MFLLDSGVEARLAVQTKFAVSIPNQKLNFYSGPCEVPTYVESAVSAVNDQGKWEIFVNDFRSPDQTITQPIGC